MAHVNRRIGKSSETANPNADGTGGGVLDSFLHDYFNRSGNLVNLPGSQPQSGLTATGGAISDYTSGSDIYRAHIFTSSGTFNVTAIGTLGTDVDFLVVGGGGAGGRNYGGAGGAGGFRSSVVAPGGPGTSAESALTISTSPGSYTITVGAGGANTPNTDP